MRVARGIVRETKKFSQLDSGDVFRFPPAGTAVDIEDGAGIYVDEDDLVEPVNGEFVERG